METIPNSPTFKEAFELFKGLDPLTNEEMETIRLISDDPSEGFSWSEIKVPPPTPMVDLSRNKDFCMWYLRKGSKFGPTCKKVHPVNQPIGQTEKAVGKTKRLLEIPSSRTRIST